MLTHHASHLSLFDEPSASPAHDCSVEDYLVHKRLFAPFYPEPRDTVLLALARANRRRRCLGKLVMITIPGAITKQNRKIP